MLKNTILLLFFTFSSSLYAQKIDKSKDELKAGKESFKNDDSANVHLAVGKISFDDNKLVENIIAFIEAIKKAKPQSLKGTYIKSIALSSTMGPGLKITL